MRLAVALLLALPAASSAAAGECASLVASMCADAPEDAVPARRVIRQTVAPPDFAYGDRFPVEERSLLLNPTRHDLPAVDGPWRYYAMNGAVYRVDNQTFRVLEVIRDARTWSLR